MITKNKLLSQSSDVDDDVETQMSNKVRTSTFSRPAFETTDFLWALTENRVTPENQTQSLEHCER